MPEQRSPLKEFRHLAEKLATVGLSPAEQARYLQLKEIVAPEPAAARPGFDVNAAAEALKASLEPAGLRRPARAPAEPGLPDLGAPPSGAGAPPVDAGSPGYDPAAPAWDPNQPYDPNAQPYDPGVQAGDPAAQAWDPNQPYDPGAPAWDPNQPNDPSASYGYAAAQPDAVDSGEGGAPGLDPGSGALNQGPVDAGTGAPAWDPAAAGSYDQPAWDAGGGSPPVDPAAALDPTAPPLDATGAGEAQAGWDAAAGQAPAVRPYDLGPEAFDAAALPPPEPGPASYDQAGWDAAAAGTVPPEPAAGPPPEGEPIEAELVDAELIEAEPSPEAPAPGSDFAPGPLAPDFAGTQPLAAGWPEAEAPAGEGQQEQAEAGFEPAEPGGPGAVEVGAPSAIDLGPVEEAAGTAAEAVPLASPSEFLSSFEPPPAPPADALDGEVAIEELPPVEMDVEEIAERHPPAAPQAPAPSIGGPAASFVAGEHRVVVHTLEGQVLRGTIADVDLDAATIPLVAGAGAAAEPIDASRVKAVFFMLLPGGRPPAPEGRKVRVTFRDGRQVAGFSADYDPEAVGFFMVPADSRTNTGRIWVYRAAVRQVSVT